MKLVEALKLSNCNQVRAKGRVWDLCRDYDDNLNFVAGAGHWSEDWLSNHYDDMDKDLFEPHNRGID